MGYTRVSRPTPFVQWSGTPPLCVEAVACIFRRGGRERVNLALHASGHQQHQLHGAYHRRRRSLRSRHRPGAASDTRTTGGGEAPGRAPKLSLPDSARPLSSAWTARETVILPRRAAWRTARRCGGRPAVGRAIRVSNMLPGANLGGFSVSRVALFGSSCAANLERARHWRDLPLEASTADAVLRWLRDDAERSSRASLGAPLIFRVPNPMEAGRMASVARARIGRRGRLDSFRPGRPRSPF
jgi:hypothetical protein